MFFVYSVAFEEELALTFDDNERCCCPLGGDRVSSCRPYCIPCDCRYSGTPLARSESRRRQQQQRRPFRRAAGVGQGGRCRFLPATWARCLASLFVSPPRKARAPCLVLPDLFCLSDVCPDVRATGKVARRQRRRRRARARDGPCLVGSRGESPIDSSSG
jgi:hypothetical protein